MLNIQKTHFVFPICYKAALSTLSLSVLQFWSRSTSFSSLSGFFCHGSDWFPQEPKLSVGRVQRSPGTRKTSSNSLFFNQIWKKTRQTGSRVGPELSPNPPWTGVFKPFCTVTFNDVCVSSFHRGRTSKCSTNVFCIKSVFSLCFVWFQNKGSGSVLQVW